ncbi:MAG: tetratricopeptide repeat protein [Candidatus Omnitrophica bacterium]|nr:tetratricopeptide repeat protein [Candidatus Omnitrophota bacterium]
MVKILKRYLGYTGVLYLIVGLALFFVLDFKHMKIYRLDTLSEVYSSYPILLSQGQETFNSQRLQGALIYYKILSTFVPNGYRAYEMQGQCYFFLKDYVHSQKMFKKALALSSQSFWLEFDQAAAAYQQGNYGMAKPLLGRILQQDVKEQYQGAVLSLLKSLSPEDRRRLLIRIPSFVDEVRARSFVLLNCCNGCRDSDKIKTLAVPMMHPWSLNIPPGKEILYD